MKLLQCTSPCRATRAEARRAHLLDVARTLFAVHGFHGTGVAQIAAASGVKVGQIYRDFQSKEDIVAALVEADLAAFLDESGLAIAVGRGDPAAVRDWISRFTHVDESMEECRMLAEIVAEAARNVRIAEIHHAIDARVRASLETALTALVPSSDRSSRLIDLIMTLGIGLTYRRIADPHLDVRGLIDQIGAIIDREIGELARAADARPATAGALA